MKYSEKEQIEIVKYTLQNDRNCKLAAEKYAVSYQQVGAWVRKFESTLTDDGMKESKKSSSGKNISKEPKKQAEERKTLDVLSRKDPFLEAQLEEVKKRLGLI
ncbi:helix-turn-helix domain-containing protein [Companilactobacillus metriopterae]|uniref:helix-turn-helix domain-containing protein n=1 Tax=Companilactobacillus metriopterae TaxID=1909267 RepID=UPI00100A5E78|nr:helix-turn-helix domain-containing protein [Companilactobacillus metriopterae]